MDSGIDSSSSKNGVSSRSANAILLLRSTLVRLILEFCVQLWDLLTYEGIGHVGASPEEEDEDDQRAGISVL